MPKIEELLHYALENGIIDASEVTEKYEMSKRQQMLDKHTFKVWQGSNGRWYTYLPDGDGRKQISKKCKADLEQEIIDYWKDETDNPTIEKLFERWIAQKMDFEDILPATEMRYRTEFDKYFENFRKCKIRNISIMDIEIFLRSAISDNRLSRKAFGNIRILMYGIFKSAKKQGYIDYKIEDVISEMEISKKTFSKSVKESKHEVFSESEEAKVIEYLEQHQDIMNLGLLLLFKSGLRIGELVALKPKDISGREIKVNKTETTFKENGKLKCEVRESAKTEAGNRTVILPDDAVWIVRKLRGDDPFREWVFQKNGVRTRAVYMRKRLYKVCDAVGIERKSPHKIRKTYGTKLIDGDVPKKMICEQMGHTDIACTEKYYYYNRLDDERKAEMINKVSGI